MKQVLALNDFENPALKNTNEKIAEYKELEQMQKELSSRMKCLKESIKEDCIDNDDLYSDDKYEVKLTHTESTRLNTHLVKKLLVKNDILEKYQTVVKGERLSINIKK